MPSEALHQTVKWIEVSVQCDGEAAEAVGELFNRFNSSPGNAQGGAVIEVGGYDSTGQLAEPVVTVRTYLAAGERAESRLQRIEQGLWFLGRLYPIPEPTIRELYEQDWANAWRAHYHPMLVGQRLLIVPAWQADEIDPGMNVLPVVLDPGMAFGTGLHPSTRLCLAALEQHLIPGSRVLDVGCGSGILSIAAARLGAASVLATDLDPVAVEATRENCQRNDLIHEDEGGALLSRIEVRQGSLPTAQERPDGWDLIVANILADVILQLLKEGMAELLADNGRLILSGIIEAQADGVITALDHHGLQVIERMRENDWIALVAASP